MLPPIASDKITDGWPKRLDEQYSDKMDMMDILPEKLWPHVALLPSFGSSFCIEPSGVMAV